MAYILRSPHPGMVNIDQVDPTLPGPVNVVLGTGSGRDAFYGAEVTAQDPVLGDGTFIFLKGVASLAVGDWVSYNALTGVTTRWAGTANSGAPLAVAMSAPSATQGGWFQVQGNAIGNCTGTVAAGDRAMFSATAAVKTAAAAGAQVLNAVAASANQAVLGSGTSQISLAATQAVYTINRPFCQGAIT